MLFFKIPRSFGFVCCDVNRPGGSDAARKPEAVPSCLSPGRPPKSRLMQREQSYIEKTYTGVLVFVYNVAETYVAR